MRKLSHLLGSVLIFGTVNANAIDFGNRLSFGGGLGRAYPIGDSDFKDSHDDGQYWGADMKYGLGDAVTFVASYANLKTENELTGDDLTLQPIVGSFRFHPFHNWALSPYLIAGAGVSLNKREFVNGTKQDWDKFTYQGGLGMELFGNQGASFGVQGLYHHFVGTADESPLRFASVMGTINIYFGEEGGTKRARKEAVKANKEIEKMKQEAEAMKAEAEKLMAEAKASQTQASLYKKEASEAEKARLEAQQMAQSAQAEIEKIKQMIAKKNISPVTFKYASSELEESSNATLDLVVETTKKYPKLNLRVEGHTDAIGNDASNLKLSQERADSVQNYLVGKGVPQDKVATVGLGETRPVANNKTKIGRAQNRRVEFIYYIP